MSRYIYVIQSLSDKNGNLYPNYVYKDTDKGRTYYSESLVELDPSEYAKYGIKQIDGSGLSQSGGTNEVKDEAYICEFTPWIMLKNILNSIIVQNFGDLKITADIIAPFLNDVIIKYGETYYNFDKKINPYILKMIEGSIVFGGTTLSKRYQFQLNRIAYCINQYCYRPAKIDSVGKQRQECDKCTAYRTEGKAQPKGYKIKYDASGKSNLIPNKVISNILIEEVDVKISYTRLCFNNYNKSYWSNLPMRNDGCKFSDSIVKVVDQLNDNELTEFTYLVPYPKRKKGEAKSANLQPRKAKPVHLIGTNTRYTCELQNGYNTYQSDIYQLDHKDGDHFNNVLTNIMVLCTNCHAIKTKLQNDKGTESEGTQIKDEIVGIVDNSQLLNAEIIKFISTRKNIVMTSYFGIDANKVIFANLYDSFANQETEADLKAKKKAKQEENKKLKEEEAKEEEAKANYVFVNKNYRKLYKELLKIKDLDELKAYIKGKKYPIGARTVETIHREARDLFIFNDLEAAKPAAAQP